jgi:two-component system nitrogen regulation response regulator GlnG
MHGYQKAPRTDEQWLIYPACDSATGTHVEPVFQRSLSSAIARPFLLPQRYLGLSPESLDVLKRYAWPGNVRELQNVLRQAVVQSTGPVLLADFLPTVVRRDDAHTRIAAPAELPANFWEQFVTKRLANSVKNLYEDAQQTMEREVITCVLRHTGGNQVEAATILGITRTTLRSKTRQLGISIDRIVHFDADNDDNNS